MRNEKGQVSGPVLAVAAGCALLYFAGEGVVKSERWLVKKSKQGIAKIFHKKTPPPAVPVQAP